MTNFRITPLDIIRSLIAAIRVDNANNNGLSALAQRLQIVGRLFNTTVMVISALIAGLITFSITQNSTSAMAAALITSGCVLLAMLIATFIHIRNFATISSHSVQPNGISTYVCATVPRNILKDNQITPELQHWVEQQHAEQYIALTFRKAELIRQWPPETRRYATELLARLNSDQDPYGKA